MSDLWRVRVVAVNDKEIRLRVEAIHPDAGAFSDSKVFALRLLADTVSRTRLNDENNAAPPLGAEVSPERYGDDAFMRQNADRFIASVSLSDVKNSPFDEDGLKGQINARLREKGLKPEDGEAWRKAFDDAWNNFWRNPGDLPSATYTIHVTDARWISHLSQGMEWNTAAYG